MIEAEHLVGDGCRLKEPNDVNVKSSSKVIKVDGIDSVEEGIMRRQQEKIVTKVEVVV